MLRGVCALSSTGFITRASLCAFKCTRLNLLCCLLSTSRLSTRFYTNDEHHSTNILALTDTSVILGDRVMSRSPSSKSERLLNFRRRVGGIHVFHWDSGYSMLSVHRSRYPSPVHSGTSNPWGSVNIVVCGEDPVFKWGTQVWKHTCYVLPVGDSG